MGKEIERKYLVNKEQWLLQEKPSGQLYRQGYLLAEAGKTIRVRQTPDKGYLTIKGKTVGATRLEYEYEIPQAEATELLDNFASAELSKIRYTLVVANKVWEVDEFLGDNAGLLVAEIELTAEDEAFTLPPWAGKEVTGELQYYNANLTTNPYKNWKAEPE